jgi:hypothetical protein
MGSKARKGNSGNSPNPSATSDGSATAPRLHRARSNEPNESSNNGWPSRLFGIGSLCLRRHPASLVALFEAGCHSQPMGGGGCAGPSLAQSGWITHALIRTRPVLAAALGVRWAFADTVHQARCACANTTHNSHKLVDHNGRPIEIWIVTRRLAPCIYMHVCTYA